ncbi:MAG TPA: 2-hydroxychromene-2-carboxylate isomerase [Burkholderiales bacterium]
MKPPIDFYFDFSSPYGYLASEKIDELAARYGRTVTWHPVLLGAIFKVTNTIPLVQMPVKGQYYVRDFARSARFLGVPFRLPDPFPVATQNAARAFLWLQDRDPAQARAFAHACYRAYFVDNVNISEPEGVLAVGARLGIDRAALGAAMADPQLKERFRALNEAAIARGVCGSPYFIIDGEPFWGADRLPQVEKWLQTGGF